MTKYTQAVQAIVEAVYHSVHKVCSCFALVHGTSYWGPELEAVRTTDTLLCPTECGT